MKKLFIFAMCAMTLASCNEGAKKAENQARAERDSLNQVIAQKDDEINDMMTTLIDIEEGFREITEAQNRVTLAKNGEGTNTKQRITENFQFIQSMMQQNKDLIAKLQQQVRESSFKSDKLKKIIADLTETMEKKDQQIAEMKEQLELKNIHIGELKYTINSMREDAQAMQDENEAQAKTINAQDKQLNTAWYACGTEKELKGQQILVKARYCRATSTRITSPRSTSVLTTPSSSTASRPSCSPLTHPAHTHCSPMPTSSSSCASPMHRHSGAPASIW